MVTLLSVAFSLALALTGVAHAQSANEFLQMFGDVVQQDMRQAAQVCKGFRLAKQNVLTPAFAGTEASLAT